MAIHELIRRNSSDMMTYICRGLGDTAAFSVLRSEWDNEHSTVAFKTLHSITFFRKARSSPHFTKAQLYELDSTFLACRSSAKLETDQDVKEYVQCIDTCPQFYDRVRQLAIEEPWSPYFMLLLRFNRNGDTTLLRSIVSRILTKMIDITEATNEQWSVLYDLAYNKVVGTDSLLLSLSHSAIDQYIQRARDYHSAKKHGDFKEKSTALRVAGSTLGYCLHALSMLQSPEAKAFLRNCVHVYNKNLRLHLIADQAWVACSTLRSSYFRDVIREYDKIGRFKRSDILASGTRTHFPGDPNEEDYYR